MDIKQSSIFNEEQVREINFATGSKNTSTKEFVYKKIYIPANFLSIRSIKKVGDNFTFLKKEYKEVLNFKVDYKTSSIYLFSGKEFIRQIIFSGTKDTDVVLFKKSFETFVQDFSNHFDIEIKELDSSTLFTSKKGKFIKEDKKVSKYDKNKHKLIKPVLTEEETFNKLEKECNIKLNKINKKLKQYGDELKALEQSKIHYTKKIVEINNKREKYLTNNSPNSPKDCPNCPKEENIPNCPKDCPKEENIPKE